MDSWDDVRVFLAVADALSFTQGAKRLGIDQATASRRVGSLEDALGQRLFVRLGRRVELTPLGARLRDSGQRVAEAVGAFDAVGSQRSAEVEGVVRLATVPEFESLVLAPRVTELLSRHPKLRLEIVADSETVSLTRREADVALRLARARHVDLVQTRVSTIRYDVYVPPSLAGVSADELPWLALERRMAALPEGRWIDANVRPDRIVYRSTSSIALAATCASGLGAALLPSSLARLHPSLIRRGPRGRHALERPVWLVVHADLRSVPRVRTTIEWLKAIVTEYEALSAIGL